MREAADRQGYSISIDNSGNISFANITTSLSSSSALSGLSGVLQNAQSLIDAPVMINLITKQDRKTARLNTTDGKSLNMYLSVSSVMQDFLHESEHAMQFLRSEISYLKNSKGEWTSPSFDLIDEISARDLEAKNGYQIYIGGYRYSSEGWLSKSKAEKIRAFDGTDYQNLPKKNQPLKPNIKQNVHSIVIRSKKLFRCTIRLERI